MLGKGRKEKDQAKINLTLIDQQVIQQDWDDREFIEVTHQFFFAYFFSWLFKYYCGFVQSIDLKIVKTVAFLNEFDSIVRSKIADMGEKLSRLERNVEYCEAAIRSTQDRLKKEGKSA